mgnify:CR=1 FL=1
MQNYNIDHIFNSLPFEKQDEIKRAVIEKSNNRKKEQDALLHAAMKSNNNNYKTHVVFQIQKEIEQESLLQMRDKEQMLQPFYIGQKRENESKQIPANHCIPEEDLRGDQKEAIRARVEARKICHLVHFTPVENVESIRDKGLLSRSVLDINDLEYIYTDEQRLDGGLNWISLSVSFPNYKMFYAKRELLKRKVGGWAVMLIKKEALWELDCRFIPTNAASFGVRKFQDNKYSSVEAFERMFTDIKRNKGIPDYYTTDPQAEVMIQSKVPFEYIEGIEFENSELFGCRSDYDDWSFQSSSQFNIDNFIINQNNIIVENDMYENNIDDFPF